MASAFQVLGVIQDKIINLNAKFTQLRYLAKRWRCMLGQSFHVNLGYLLLDIGRSVKCTTTTVNLHCLLGPIWGRFEVTLRPISDGQNILLTPSERRSEIARTSFHFKTKKRWITFFCPRRQSFTFQLMASVTRFGVFWKFPPTPFCSKVAQMFSDGLSNFEKHQFLRKNCCGYSLGNLWIFGATFYFNIWSHWFRRHPESIIEGLLIGNDSMMPVWPDWAIYDSSSGTIFTKVAQIHRNFLKNITFWL